MRQIVLDTETTGLSPKDGHRVIEIGCVELVNRRLTGNIYHTYLNPGREVDPGAMRVHGITNEFLLDKPIFEDIAEEFKTFVEGAELIIHNAPFDLGFLDNELKITKDKWKSLEKKCKILDTLVLARQKHPGQKNNLDALCKRYEINNQHRTYHGALLDSEILAEVYLLMTGGQTSFKLGEKSKSGAQQGAGTLAEIIDLPVIKATEVELAEHTQRLADIKKKAGRCVWED